jgi:hypothetical protein
MSPDQPRTPLSEDHTYCSVCAWRATCQKKFTFDQTGAGKCPDYTRDLALPAGEREQG